MFFALIDTAQTRSQRRRRRRDPSQVLLPGSQARGAETLTGAGISDNGLILRWVGTGRARLVRQMLTESVVLASKANSASKPHASRFMELPSSRTLGLAGMTPHSHGPEWMDWRLVCELRESWSVDRKHAKMLKGLFDGRTLFRRTGFGTLVSLTIGSIA